MNQQPEPKQAAADTASEETATPVKQTPAAKTPSAPAPGKKKIDISMLSTERDS